MRALLAALLVSLAVACSSSKGSGGGQAVKPFNAADRQTCTTSDDCTLVDACCGCNAGGRRVAIRKDAVADYDATRPQRCGDQVCTQVMSSHSSCDAEASCIEGVCKIMSHMGGAPN